MESQIDIIRAAYGNFSPARIDALANYLATDFEFILHADRAFVPHAGRFRGLEELRRFCTAYDDLLECHGDGPQQFRQEGSLVIVRGTERSTVRSNGRRYTTWWMHLIEFRGDKVLRWEEFLDSNAVALAFALRQLPEPGPPR